MCGYVLATGNFDGLHLGHQKIFGEVLRLAEERALRPLILTFEPHTRLVLRPAEKLFLLTPGEEKTEWFRTAGVPLDTVAFTEELAELDAEDYVRRLIVPRGVKVWVLGENHRFGRGGLGDAALLRNRFPEIEVMVVDAARDSGDSVSSSLVRELLDQGDIERVNRILGRPYSVRGRVIRGDGRGREIGYPTANLNVDLRKKLPKFGVYAGFARVDDQIYRAVANFGNRPTFPGAGASVEVHLLDFSGQLYGKNLEIKLNLCLREERRFAQVSALRDQIARDVEKARSVLNENNRGMFP